MALKFEVASLDAVPEAQRALYVQRDGKFFLDVEGVAPASELTGANARLVEFRDNNIKILKALGVASVDEAMQRAAVVAGIDPARLAKLKDVDPDEYAALKAKVGKLKEKGVDDPEGVDARFKSMLDAALAGVNAKLDASEKARTEAQQRADDALLRQAIGERFQKAGGRTDALEFVVGKARESFRVVDNAVKPQDAKFSKDKPGEPLTPEEWLTGVAKEYPFAFAPSQGGGAAPSGPAAIVTPPQTFKVDGKELSTAGITVLP